MDIWKKRDICTITKLRDNINTESTSYISEYDVYKIVKENGMGVVIKKLPHPNKFTHKITSKKGVEVFLRWVS